MVLRKKGQKTVEAVTLIILMALSGCNKPLHKSPAAAKAETKRQQTACASPAAYDHLKNLIFDAAVAQRSVDRTNLDTLADYSVVRMENPVVTGWDGSLDVTRCRGRFILEVPPGAQSGLAGQRQLEADITYTAQPSADGGGLVYQQAGAEAIIAKLAAFRVSPGAYRPPPAIDPGQVPTDSGKQASSDQPPLPRPASNTSQRPAIGAASGRPKQAVAQKNIDPKKAASAPAPVSPLPLARRASSGEATVRAFYGALGAGNGAAAASQVTPEKRSGGPYSAGAMSRFYGHLAEPIRLTSLQQVGDGRYRVTYRYSAGRSHCTGAAVVRLTKQAGRDLITSIRSLSGC